VKEESILLGKNLREEVLKRVKIPKKEGVFIKEEVGREKLISPL
jgi:hypothetical protein